MKNIHEKTNDIKKCDFQLERPHITTWDDGFGFEERYDRDLDTFRQIKKNRTASHQNDYYKIPKASPGCY
jgi:hypothetical protein